MNLPFLSADDLWPVINDQTVILTANVRLPQVLRLWHGEHCRAQGQVVWPALQALPVDAWLQHVLENGLLSGHIAAHQLPGRVLGSLEEAALWETVVDEVEQDPLRDTRSLAKAAQEADAPLAEWQTDVPDALATEEWRHFLRWQQVFLARCQQAGSTTRARWRQSVLGLLPALQGWLPQRAVLSGFAELSPFEVALCEQLLALGVEVVRLNPALADSQRSVVATQDTLAECQAAAQWALQHLQAHPHARLGLVVPDLAQVRDTLSAVLEKTLHPELAFSDQCEPILAYNLSLGLPLAQRPLVQTALELLACLAEPHAIPFQRVGTLLAAPYWGSWTRESHARARLDARLRQANRLDWTLAAWQREAAKVNAPDLQSQLALLQQQSILFKASRLPSQWAAELPALWHGLGWPGTRPLNTHEYQTQQAFEEALQQLNLLDDLLGKISLRQLSNWVSRIAREKVFQPQQKRLAPLQVMGLLEAAGQRFDALWVMGLTDQTLPALPRPNPLIPPDVQRQALMPHASAEREYQWARDILDQLQACAPVVWLSYPRQEGDRDLKPSPLLGAAGTPCTTLPAQAIAEAPPLEWLDDSTGLPPLLSSTSEGAATVSGGTWHLAVQAQCPQAAYVRYRLHGRKLETPSTGLDMRERGNLLHLALRYFWDTHRTQAALLAMSPAEREAAIQAAIEQGWQELLRPTEHDAARSRLQMLEENRLRRLMQQWLAYEASRPPFEVLAVEYRHQVVIDGIQLDTQIDRIDRLLPVDPAGEAALAIIDYKTGKASAGDWAAARLTAPQMPLYALQPGEENGPLAAVAYARISAKEQSFSGVACHEATLPDMTLPGGKGSFNSFENWEALLAHWEAAIRTLIAEIRAADARPVSWVNSDSLQWLDAWPFLRANLWTHPEEDSE